MINFYKTVESSITEIEEFESGCWVNIVAPDEDELDYAACITGADLDLLRAPLDDEESSRAEIEEDSQTFPIFAEGCCHSCHYCGNCPSAFIINI